MIMQSAIKYFFKTIITGLIVSFVIFIISVSLEYFFGRIVKLDAKLAKEIGYYVIYGVTLSFINGAWFDFLNQKVDWSKFESFAKYRLIIGAFGGVILTLCGIFFVRFFIKVIIEGHAFNYFLQNEKIGYYYVSLIITIIVSLVFHLIYFYKAFQEKKVVEQKIIAGTATAKFESLKNQLDPHFLFNSLNVLSSLIEENPEIAQKFTTSLSKVYRYVLDQRDKELITIAEEIDFAKTYVKLLQMRFEKAVYFELDETLNSHQGFVVPLCLQLLLENSIKHNVVSDAKPLTIKIYIQDKALVIENNLQIKESFSDRKGVGIENIVNRYALLTKREVMIEKSNDYYKVLIPILTKQIDQMKQNPISNESIALIRAKERLENIKGFYGNLMAYLFVVPTLVIINLFVQKINFQWFWFPLVFWGMGVVIHAFEVFGYVRKWEEKKIKELMRKS
jgi:hypothetical protein